MTTIDHRRRDEIAPNIRDRLLDSRSSSLETARTWPSGRNIKEEITSCLLLLLVELDRNGGIPSFVDHRHVILGSKPTTAPEITAILIKLACVVTRVHPRQQPARYAISCRGWSTVEETGRIIHPQTSPLTIQVNLIQCLLIDVQVVK